MPSQADADGDEDEELWKQPLLTKWFFAYETVGEAWRGTEGLPLVCGRACARKILGREQGNSNFLSQLFGSQMGGDAGTWAEAAGAAAGSQGGIKLTTAQKDELIRKMRAADPGIKITEEQLHDEL